MRRITALLLVAVLALAMVPSVAMAQVTGHSTDVGISASATEVIAGTVVDLTITEANDGQLPLSSPSVDLDPQGVTLTKGSASFVGGDTNNDGVLDPGETWQWGVSDTVDDDITYTVTGHGFLMPPLPSFDITYPRDLQERESLTVTVTQEPAVDLVKTVNPTTVSAPGNVTYSYTVTNTGNVALTGLVLTDDKAGAITLAATTLAPGASTTGTAVFAITQAMIDAGAPIVNVATLTSTQGATDTATATVTVTQEPAVDLVKTVNGEDADSPTGPVVAVGDTVTFTFVVNNTGNVALTNVVVTDDVLGAIGAIPSLAVGASQTLTATAPAATGQQTNIGSVTTDQGVTDTDPGNYFGETPGDEGLTPGFWKNNADKHGASQWTDFEPTDLVSSVFSSAGLAPYTDLGDATLLEGLSFKGGHTIEGAAGILLRAAIAAVLNAAHPDVDYPLSLSDIQTQVNSALDNQDRDTILGLASELDGYNNLGADLSQNP